MTTAKMICSLLLLAATGCTLGQRNNGEVGFRFSGFGIGFYHNAPADGSEVSANVPAFGWPTKDEPQESVAPDATSDVPAPDAPG